MINLNIVLNNNSIALNTGREVNIYEVTLALPPEISLGNYEERTRLMFLAEDQNQTGFRKAIERAEKYSYPLETTTVRLMEKDEAQKYVSLFNKIENRVSLEEVLAA